VSPLFRGRLGGLKAPLYCKQKKSFKGTRYYERDHFFPTTATVLRFRNNSSIRISAAEKSYSLTLGSLAPHHSFLSLEPVVRQFYVDEFPTLFAFFVQPGVQIFGLA
jgi:hypothetical protein